MMAFGARRATARAATRATASAVLGAFGIAGALLALPLLAGRFFHGTDLTRGDLGAICALQQQLAAGASPWLSPFIGNGSPLLANPQAQLLYPLRWLVLALPADVAASVAVGLHLAIGAAGAAWLARTLRARPFTSLCAGVAFALSGTALDAMTHSVFVLDVAWTPIAWAALRRALHRGARAGPVPFCALATALTAMLVGGEPQAFVVTAGVFVVEVLGALCRARPLQAKLLDATLASLVVVASFLCGLVVWGPGFAELALTSRSGALREDEVFHWSFEPLAALGTVLPNLATFLDPMIYLHSLVEGDARAQLPWNPAPYVGFVVVTAALTAFSIPRLRVGVIVGVLAVLAALGKRTAFLPLLHLLAPPLARFRYPSKYLVIADLALVVVGVVLFDRLQRDRRRRALFATLLLPALGVLAGVLVLDAREGALLDVMAQLLRPDEGDTGLPRASEVVFASALHACIAGVLALACALFRPRLVPLVVVVDLLAAAPASLHFGPPLATRTSPLLALEQHDGPAPILCVDPTLDGIAAYPEAGRELPSMWHRDAATRALLLRELQACDRMRAPVSYVPIATRMQTLLMDGVGQRSVLAARALGCTHLVTAGPVARGGVRPVSFASLHFTPDGALDGIWDDVTVYEIEGPVPDAFIAREARLAIDEPAAAVKIRAARDTGALVAVLDDPLSRMGTGAALPSGDDVTSVALRGVDTDALDLLASGTGGAVLGVRTAFHVGWTARQAGLPLPVIRSSGQHVAVVVDDVAKGPIELRYENPRMRESLGAAIAGASLVIACAIVAQRRRGAFSAAS